MLLKFIGLILIVLTGASWGNVKSERLKSERNSSRLLVEIVGQISTFIRFKGLTFYEIARELQSVQAYSELGFICNIPQDYDGQHSFSEMWQRAADGDSVICEEAKDLLKNFGATVGSSDTDGQLSELELLRTRLETLEKKQSEIYAQKGRLYRGVGALGGLMLAIVLM